MRSLIPIAKELRESLLFHEDAAVEHTQLIINRNVISPLAENTSWLTQNYY